MQDALLLGSRPCKSKKREKEKKECYNKMIGNVSEMYNPVKSDNSLKFDALAKIKLNDSFQFYHNTNGVIHNTAGITFIYGSGSGNISLQAQAGAQNISCAPNGGTSLYYQGSQKFYTVSDGVYINDNLGIQDSIQHILDTDTKIRFPSNDTISFETGGSERFRIDQYGNAGLGVAPRTAAGGVNNDTDVFLAIGDNDTGIAQDGDGQFEIWANNQEIANFNAANVTLTNCLLYTSPSPRDLSTSRMPSSA